LFNNKSFIINWLLKYSLKNNTLIANVIFSKSIGIFVLNFFHLVKDKIKKDKK